MPKIIDPDQLNIGTELVIDTTGPKTIQLVATGNLDDDSPAATSGATMQAVYSAGVDAWESTLAYRRHSFFLRAYTPGEMEWINSWGPADEQTRDLIRDAGWIETDGRKELGLVSLGAMVADTDASHYEQADDEDGTVGAFDKTGRLNEHVTIVGTGGTPVNTSFLGVWNRVRPNFYDYYELIEGLQLSVLDPKAYSIPLGNAPDPNIVESDVNIDGNTPYTNMTLDYLTGAYGKAGVAGGAETWQAAQTYATGDAIANSSGRYFRVTTGGTSAGNDSDLAGGSDTGVSYEVHPGEYQIGTTYYLFSRIIDAATGLNSETYQWGARQERQATDINDDVNGDTYGAVKGQLAEHLFAEKGAGFDGTKLTLAEGVYVDDPAAADKNNIVFFPHSLDGTYPNSNQGVQFPFKVSLDFVFTANLVGGVCTVFFENDDAGDNLGYDFDTDDAIVVDDDVAADMDFTITGTDMSKSFDYDVNVQRGTGSDGTDAPLKVVTVYAGSTEPLVTDATAVRVDSVVIRVNASDDRNYSNPV